MARILDGFAADPPEEQEQDQVKERKGENEDSADELKLQGKNSKAQQEGGDENPLEDHPGFLPKPVPSPILVESEEVKNKGPEGKD
jgi:hypothetical protein